MTNTITVISVPPPAITVLMAGAGLQGPPGPPGPGGGAAALVFVAGESLGGHRAIVLDAAGLAWYANNLNPAHLGRFAGITLGAASIGTEGSAIASGLLTEPSWAWVPDAPVYLSTSGLLTQDIAVAGFLQVIGQALSATTLFINPRDPIVTL